MTCTCAHLGDCDPAYSDPFLKRIACDNSGVKYESLCLLLLSKCDRMEDNLYEVDCRNDTKVTVKYNPDVLTDDEQLLTSSGSNPSTRPTTITSINNTTTADMAANVTTTIATTTTKIAKIIAKTSPKNRVKTKEETEQDEIDNGSKSATVVLVVVEVCCVVILVFVLALRHCGRQYYYKARTQRNAAHEPLDQSIKGSRDSTEAKIAETSQSPQQQQQQEPVLVPTKVVSVKA